MNPSLHTFRLDSRLMAFTAAAMYGGAGLVGAVEAIIPGDPPIAMVPVAGAAVITVMLLLLGPRLPRWLLAPLGPLGVVLIANSLAATPGAGDGAVLYMWPVLWTTFFYGRRGAIVVLLCVGVAHGLALLSLPPSSSYPGRWVDVMASGSVVAAVVLMLLHRNRLLIDQLADDARTDALTGVFNRRGFDERARIELARARRDRDAIAVVTFDIDFFKRVNDEWGHQIGDMVLARLGAILKAEARDLDVVARFGGEEFVVLLPSCDSACAEVFATRIRAVLAAQDPGALPTVRVSAGVTASIAPEDLNTLLRAADAAMYEAKRAGRDRTVVVEHEAPPRHEEPGRLLAARLS